MSEDTPRPRRRFFLFGGVLALLGLLALPTAFAGGDALGFGGHCHRGAHGELTAEQMQKKADKVASRILNRVDATDPQRAEVQELLAGVGERAVAARADHQEARQAWREALLAETIDEQQLEALRVDLLDRVDDGSTELLGLVADIAQVLTPEQRADLAELADSFHGRR